MKRIAVVTVGAMVVGLLGLLGVTPASLSRTTGLG